MIARLLGAVQYLTVIPVSGRTAPPGQSALFFPLIGAVLGAAGGLALEWTRGYIPFTLVCLVVLAFWTAITGGLHEDGFADVADAFRAYRPAEKIHAILKDPGIGAHGALALLLLTLVRWQSLSAITAPAVPALAAALGIARVSVVALAWTTPPAGAGGGLSFNATLTSGVAVAVIVQGVLLALWPGGRASSLLLAGATAIVMLSRTYFTRRIGGVTGDCLGATEQLVETWCLVIYSCGPCTL